MPGRSAEEMRAIAHLGGAATKAKYGAEFYAKISSAGGKAAASAATIARNKRRKAPTAAKPKAPATVTPPSQPTTLAQRLAQALRAQKGPA